MRDTLQLLRRYPALQRLALVRFRRRIPIVRQLAVTDCGAAALAMVLAYFGKSVSLEELRLAIGVGRSGSTAAALLETGRAYGLSGRGIRVDIEDLCNLSPGVILYWRFSHFVVLERVRRRTIDIIDPSSGRRRVPIEQFRRAFTGVALVFEPSHPFQPQQTKRKTVSGFLRRMLDHRNLLARIIGTSLLVQMLSATMPLFTGLLIDRVVPQSDYSLLIVLGVGFCLFQLANAIATFIRAQLFIHLRTRLEVTFTLRFLDHLVDLPYSYFQQHTSGDLIMRLGSNTTVREILTSTILSTIMDGTLASIYLVLLIMVSVPLTLMVVGLATSRLLVLFFMRWRQRQFLGESLENQARAQTYQVELLTGMETLKAMGLEHRAAENWSNVFIDGLNISIKLGHLDAVFNVMLNVLGTATTLTLMFYGTYLVLQGNLTLGTMMAFSALAGGFLVPLNTLLSVAVQLQMLEVYLERLNDVINTPPEQEPDSHLACHSLSGAVALDNVSFRYNRQDSTVIDRVSLEVPARAHIALVGRTGSGKSTLARLMAGLYDPTEGRILFDGRDLKTLDRRSVRRKLGIVTQDTQLFSGSIRRNIALADPHMGLDQVIQAAQLACIHDDIIALPMGYDTPLTDRGLSLSGGQRQRLAIARAIANNPTLLILDEATSHLDAATEQLTNHNLASLRCTRIVIAHRLSTIREANQIMVLEAGRLVEQGRHDDLLKSGGTYARLIGFQREDGTCVED